MRNYGRTIIMVAVASLLLGSFADIALAQFQQPPPQPQPARPRPAAPAPAPHLGSELSPVTVKVLPDPEADKRAKEEQLSRQQITDISLRIASHTERIADFTVWLTLALAGLGVAAIGQLLLFWFQLRAMRGVSADSQRASTAAEKAAEATAASIEINRANGIRQLRAYVFAQGPKVINVDLNGAGSNAPAEASIIVKNTGLTPAYDLVHRAAIRLAPFPATPAVFDVKDSEAQSKIVLAAGETGENTVSLGRPLSAEEKNKLGLGQMAVYVFGSIKYNDAFGVPRTTEYRLMTGGNVGFKGDSLTPLSEGNRAT